MLIVGSDEAPDDRNRLRCAGCISEGDLAKQVSLARLFVFVYEPLRSSIRGREYV